jgi:hypothetical protein
MPLCPILCLKRTALIYIMLDEPPIPETDFGIFTQLCLAEGKVVVNVNSLALASLLWDFWFLVEKCPAGEDISFSNSDGLSGAKDCVPLCYCEITMTGEGPMTGVLHNPVAEFLHRESRVDLFVNRLQAERGYQSLQRLGDAEAGKFVEQVELFGRLIVRLIPEPSAV